MGVHPGLGVGHAPAARAPHEARKDAVAVAAARRLRDGGVELARRQRREAQAQGADAGGVAVAAGGLDLARREGRGFWGVRARLEGGGTRTHAG
jgi:hypothetical protein